MNILIKNCNLISMDEAREKIEYGIDILIEENKIKLIQKCIEVEADKVIDATDRYVMPGLINTHSHIGMSIFRETVDGYNLQDWLEKKIWPIEDTLTENDIYKSSLYSCTEMIKTGTTTVNDHYFYPEHVAKAIAESGLRAEVTRVLMDSDGNLEERANELENAIKNISGKYDTVTVNVGIHGLYTASAQCVEKAIALAEKYGLNVHMHFCENSTEVKQIQERYNVDVPSEVLKKYFSDVNTILAHCVKLNDADFETLKHLHINVSHCPVSNLKLGCGVADIAKMLENGINVSLGTDGQGSGCNLDMFDTMKFVGLLQKGINEDPTLIPAYEVLKMATINGAKALNKADQIGSITAGKYADLIILDLSSVTLQPINDVFSDIVYNAKGTNVITTIVNGKILYVQ